MREQPPTPPAAAAAATKRPRRVGDMPPDKQARVRAQRREANKRWRARHPDRFRASVARLRARKRVYRAPDGNGGIRRYRIDAFGNEQTV